MKRFILWVEIALGVIPITIVGGFYALLGAYFGLVSIIISISHRSLGSSLFWLGILALAIGGLTGIAGLWSLVATGEGGRRRPKRHGTFAAAAVGVLTALAALALAVRNDGVHWLTVYLLLSPAVVACHRAYQVSAAQNSR